MSKQVDPSTQIMLAITLVLFVVALFQKGFRHELLVEAAIFAVSTKLVLMPTMTSVNNDAMGEIAEVSESGSRIEQTLGAQFRFRALKSLSEGTLAVSSNSVRRRIEGHDLWRAPLRRGVGSQHGGIMGPAVT